MSEHMNMLALVQKYQNLPCPIDFSNERDKYNFSNILPVSNVQVHSLKNNCSVHWNGFWGQRDVKSYGSYNNKHSCIKR